MIIQKFGGTSVGSADNMVHVTEIVCNSEPSVVVVSAVGGITDKISQIHHFSQKREYSKALDLLENVKLIHEEISYRLIEDEVQLSKCFHQIESIISSIKELILSPELNQFVNQIMGFGELLCTSVIKNYWIYRELDFQYIPAASFMHTKENGEIDYDLSGNCLSNLKESTSFVLTEGFICTNNLHQIDNLGRGGSDLTASIIGNLLNAEIIKIWTDIDGVHNSDPRFVERTKTVETLSYDEAAELAYFGAKILHPQTILPAKRKGIPVQVKNTFNSSATGTTINRKMSNRIISSVATRSGITILTIKSSRMLMAFGFLKEVFQIFSELKIPVDLITTSEVSVSVTIDNDKNLDELVKRLNGFGHVSVKPRQSIIAIVGSQLCANSENLSQVVHALKSRHINMLCYGSSRNSISLVCDEESRTHLLRSLHENIIQQSNYDCTNA